MSFLKYIKFRFAVLLVVIFIGGIPLIKSLFAEHAQTKTDTLLIRLKQIYVTQPDEAVRLAKNYLISNQHINPEIKIRLSIYLGADYYYLGKPDSSLMYLDTALNLSNKINNQRLLANSYNAQAIIHIHLGNYEKALRMNKSACNLYRQLNDTMAMVNSLKGIANTFLRMDHNDSAIYYNIQTLTILGKKIDTTGLNYKAGLMMNIGSLLDKHQFNNILRYYLNAEQLFVKTGNEKELARLYNNIGSLYYDMGKTDTALSYLSKSVSLKKLNRLKRNLSSSLLLMGDCYKRLGKPDMAKQYFKEAYKTAGQVEDNYYLTLSTVSITQIYLEEQKTDSARYYLTKLNTQKANIESLFLKTEINRIKSKYYLQTNNYRKAFQYYRLYKVFSDSLSDIKMAKATLELEKKYQTELKEKKNQQLQNQLLIKQHKEKQQKLYLIILVSGSIILIMVVLLLIKLLNTRSKSIQWLKQLRKTEMEKARLEKLEHEQRMASEKTIRKLQEEKHRQEIELSNRKLATLAMQIMNKNEILREIEVKLNTPNGKNNLRNINNLIKTSFNFDKNWEMLKRHFEKVHPGFFTSLKKRHPNLTDYDLRLAAYLKIHLTTKEIAQIINVTPAAINKSRQRLRKKMNLSGDVDFGEYFNAIC